MRGGKRHPFRPQPGLRGDLAGRRRRIRTDAEEVNQLFSFIMKKKKYTLMILKLDIMLNL